MEIGDFTPTSIFIIIVFFVVIIYDVYAYLNKDLKTVSAVVRGWSWYNPMIPFIAGMLCGHWFW